jgi:ABC-type glutathione transport system ATPase component
MMAEAPGTVDPRTLAHEAATPSRRIAIEPLLMVAQLVKHYPIRGGPFGLARVGAVRAVDGVSLAVARGQTLGLVGESGCGKTTLSKVILGLVPPTSGTVAFGGEIILHAWASEPGQRASKLASASGRRMKEVRRRLQVIFQDPYRCLDPRMSVAEIIGEGPLIHGLGDRRRREKLVRDLLDKVGLIPSLLHR